jgi:Ser-tRNA(Ala) deacylase AlaX
MKKPELARLAVGLPKDLQEFRITRIGDIDEQVDGGTHINHLKEIGKIKLTKTVNKGAMNRRLYFIID